MFLINLFNWLNEKNTKLINKIPVVLYIFGEFVAVLKAA